MNRNCILLHNFKQWREVFQKFLILTENIIFLFSVFYIKVLIFVSGNSCCHNEAYKIGMSATTTISASAHPDNYYHIQTK